MRTCFDSTTPIEAKRPTGAETLERFRELRLLEAEARELRSHPDETGAIARELRRITTEAKTIRDELIVSNMALAQHVANRISGPDVDPEGKQSDAMLGLVKAVDGFDPDRGCVFSTFAWRAISNEIFAAIDRARRARLAEEAAIERAMAPSDEPIGEAFGVTAEDVREAVDRLDVEAGGVIARLFGLAGEPATLKNLAAQTGIGRLRLAAQRDAGLDRLRTMLA